MSSLMCRCDIQILLCVKILKIIVTHLQKISKNFRGVIIVTEKHLRHGSATIKSLIHIRTDSILSVAIQCSPI